MEFKNLSLHEKVCQMLIVKLDPEKHIKKYGSIKNFLEQYPVGGIFIAREILFDDSYDFAKTKALIEEYQKYSKIPLLVAADAERGAKLLDKSFTNQPPPMALGSVRDKQAAYDYGKAIAKECRSMGVNWTLAPVCDLTLNRYNEIVSTRSISNIPEVAAEFIGEVVKGFQENGMLTNGKHFPGDGCDVRNQHIVGSVNNLSKEEWMNTYGRVFKAAFDAGMASVMIGHISVPAFQNDAIDGVYPPATLSKDAIDLLKNTLGFKGVALTDAMDMGGFVRWHMSRKDAEVESFRCGMDMMLWPREETSDLIEQAIEKGEIPMSRLDDALERIAFLKSTLEPYGFMSKEDESKSEFSRKTRDKLALNCSTLARNRLNLIPINADKIKKVRIISAVESFLSDNCDATKVYVELAAEAFRRRGAEVEVKYEWDVYLEDYEAGEIDTDYDLIVYATVSTSALPLLFGRQLVNLHSAQRFDEEKTVVLLMGTPHYLTEYYPIAKTAVHTYPDEACIEAAVAGIYGETEFKGVLPINI